MASAIRIMSYCHLNLHVPKRSRLRRSCSVNLDGIGITTPTTESLYVPRPMLPHKCHEYQPNKPSSQDAKKIQGRGEQAVKIRRCRVGPPEHGPDSAPLPNHRIKFDCHTTTLEKAGPGQRTAARRPDTLSKPNLFVLEPWVHSVMTTIRFSVAGRSS